MRGQSQLSDPTSLPLTSNTERFRKDEMPGQVPHGEVSSLCVMPASPPENDLPPHSHSAPPPLRQFNQSPDIVVSGDDDRELPRFNDSLTAQQSVIPGLVPLNSDLETPSEKKQKIPFNNQVFPQDTPGHKKKKSGVVYHS
ncbi:hypothetical protein EQU50_04980 [Candidatus Finniella inopinata]|uniref:Uncharacterized protein n=1 Tax=Candidatus Finniella inopinata TaxID=1696036 RepID=A0A4Q7DHV9_9PROT|nr:hypothetical protein EQU50_04980 [Candidatus Finniella inopinata]